MLKVIDLVTTQSRRCPLLAESQSWYPYQRGVYRMPEGNGGVDLGSGRELWAGYTAAGKVPTPHSLSSHPLPVPWFLQVGEGMIPYLNVDISNTAFYKKQPFLQTCCDILNEEFDTSRFGGGGRGGRGRGRGGGRGGYGGGRGGYGGSGGGTAPMFTADRLRQPSPLDAVHIRALKRGLVGEAPFVIPTTFSNWLDLSGLKLKTTHMIGPNNEDRNRVYKFSDLLEQSCAQTMYHTDFRGSSFAQNTADVL